jgi:site-specific recombinase XerD
MSPVHILPALIERFFTERLMRQRHVSPNTVASYRDTFRLLFKFAQARLHRPPSSLDLSDRDAPLIAAFLEDLETQRSVSVRTRNLRLTAIRSFFRFVAFEEPAYAAHIQRVLAIPTKRYDKQLVQFLTRTEIDALLDAPDKTTWLGRRDYGLLLLAIQTGLRLSELTGLDRDSVQLVAAHTSAASVRGATMKISRLCTVPRHGHPLAVLRLAQPWGRGVDSAHNYRLSRNCIRRSGGRYRVILLRGGCNLLSARSFIARSASTYM